MSTLALKGVLEQLVPDLRVRFDATNALLELIAAGEPADLVILTADAIADLQKKGKISASTALGRSGVGIAVRSGAPKPDISTVEALKSSLLSAESIAHSKIGASGIYFVELLKRLGIAQRLKRIVIVERGPVGAVVAAGGAEIGVQQLCELAPVRGIDIVGPLPEPLQKITAFSAGLFVNAVQSGAALGLIELLKSEKGRAAMRLNGMEPV